MSSTPNSQLVLIHDDQARLVLDPVDTSNSPPSISFNITFTWAMPFQSCTIEDRECWIEHDELNRFESDLSRLFTETSGEIVLRNMSNVPVLTLSRDENSVVICYHAADTSGMGPLYSQSPPTRKNYRKWRVGFGHIQSGGNLVANSGRQHGRFAAWDAFVVVPAAF